MKWLLVIVSITSASSSIATEFNFELLNISTHVNDNQGFLNPDDFLQVDNTLNETVLITTGTLDIGSLSVNFRNRASYTAFAKHKKDRTNTEWQEVSVDKMISANLMLNLGKTQLPWDMSMSFQPLGFFQKELNVLDITDNKSESSGLPLVALSYLDSNWHASIVYSHDYENDIDGFNKGLEQWAIRWVYLDEKWEFSAVAQKAQGQPVGVGMNANYTLNDHLIIYGSSFVRQGTRRPQDLRILTDDYQFTGRYPFRYTLLDSDDTFEQLVIGASFTLEKLSLIAEFSHDATGLNNNQWHTFINNNLVHHALYKDPLQKNLGMLALYYDNQAISRTGTRKHYLFLNVSTDFENSRLGLFSKIDTQGRSSITGASYLHQLTDSLDVNVNYTVFSGGSKSEFGGLPVASEFEIMFKYLI